MKFFYYVLAIFSLIWLSSCDSNVEMKEGTNHFGAEINETGAVSIETGIIQLSSVDTVDIKILGTIEEVCQAKGCWMTIQDENSTAEVFIKFKDYAFFVPKNAAGKKVVVSGKLYNTTTSVEELQHYAEDKGASSDEIAAITEPEKELRMMADGVIIYN